MADSSFVHNEGIEADDSEWEYEYHETETESFYVTLDLSSAVDHTHPKKKSKKSTPPTSSVPEAAEATQAVNDDQDVTQEQNGTVQGEEMQDGNDLIMSNAKDNQPPPEEPEDRIQILDLHSSNPIISYQGQIYSCEWTSTIGTDILLSASDPDFLHPVLKDEGGVSIIAATGIKLFGRPIELTPRSNASAGNEQAASTTSAPTDSTVVAENASAPETPVKITIPPNLTTTKAREKQAKFLERLIAIKAAKAEKDEVTVHSQRAPKKPGLRSNIKPSEKRRAAEAQEAESARVNGDDDVGGDDMPMTPAVQRKTSTRGRASAGRPRGRKPGRRTQKGGLFRDYRPSPNDTAGADIRNAPSSTATPDSWDQLYPVFSPTNDENNNAINTPHPPQASSPRTSQLSDSRPHTHTHPHHSPRPPTPTQNLDPALFHPPPPPPQTTRSSSAANASATAAIASAAGAPSLIVTLRTGRRMIGERRSAGGAEGARSGIVDGGIEGGGGVGDVGGGGIAGGGDGDVEMEDV